MSAQQSTESGRTTSIPTPVVTDRELSTDPEDQIRAVAYQLYEARGRADGHDLDDWLRAEEQVLGIRHRAAA